MGEGGEGEGEKRKGKFPPSALSLFRFHLSPFPPETPDTQAIQSAVCFRGWVDCEQSLIFLCKVTARET